MKPGDPGEQTLKLVKIDIFVLGDILQLKSFGLVLGRPAKRDGVGVHRRQLNHNAIGLAAVTADPEA